jgi:hypothetical protein
MSGIIDPPKTVVNTLTINNYKYTLSNVIPHTSVQYDIYCYNDTLFVKFVSGLIEGEQYKEWTTDDWMDVFIKSKVYALDDDDYGNIFNLTNTPKIPE